MTFETFHELTSNEFKETDLNIEYISSTLDTFQFEISKFLKCEPSNILVIYLTFETSHELKFELLILEFLNIFFIFSTFDESNFEESK